MSRITTPPVEAGQTTNATTLNNTYNDYSQAGALNADNTRDQAFDLPHFDNVTIIRDFQAPVTLGNSQMLHIAPFPAPVAADTASPPTLTTVATTAGTPTLIDWSADPWTLSPGECLRVWWNLSVYIEEPAGSPWLTAGVLGLYVLPRIGGGPDVTISDGMHCFLAYLQWDITDATLTNWVAVPGQSDPSVNIGGTGYDGFWLNELNASTCIGAWALTGDGFPRDGKLDAANPQTGWTHGWYGLHGMYVHAPAGGTSPTTIYGIRIVITGILHPAHTAGGRNLLIYDYTLGSAASIELVYTSGRLQAIRQRMN